MANALTVNNDTTPNQNHHYLNQWAELMMEDIWHFNQCAGIGAPMQTANDKAGGVYLQKEREYIARHLDTAANRMAADLNYWICPAYFTETIQLGRGAPFQRQHLQTRFCNMIELGKRATSVIQSGASVGYSDPNSVGVADLATVTVTTTVTNPDEIRLYYQVSDGSPTVADPRYEIEPVQVLISGGVATITAHRANFVKPTQWKREYIANDPNFNSPNVIDTADPNGFVTKVDVIRVYTDTSANINLYSTDGTLLQSYTGEIINPRLSIFRLGDLCAGNAWCEYPQRVVVNYKAGSATSNGRIDNELFEACAAYAAGSMGTQLTKMSYWALEQFNNWRKLMVDTVGGNIIPAATKRQMGSGYGVRVGQVKAWEITLDRRIEKGHKLTR